MDSIRELAALYTEHGFITADKADCFMAEVTTIGDSRDEAHAHVTDQLLGISKHSLNLSIEHLIGSPPNWIRISKCKLPSLVQLGRENHTYCRH